MGKKSSTHVLESMFVDMTDDQLKDVVGKMHENIKQLAEALKLDQEIEDLKMRAKELEKDRYRNKMYGLSQQLKAARRLAKARGIVFKLDEIAIED